MTKTDKQYSAKFMQGSADIVELVTGMPVHTGDPCTKDTMYNAGDIYAMAAVTGTLQGTVMIRINKHLAKDVALKRRPFPSLSDDHIYMRDAFGELANLIMGRIAVLFSEEDKKIAFSDPVIVSGENIHVSQHKCRLWCFPVWVATKDWHRMRVYVHLDGKAAS